MHALTRSQRALGLTKNGAKRGSARRGVEERQRAIGRPRERERERRERERERRREEEDAASCCQAVSSFSSLFRLRPSQGRPRRGAFREACHSRKKEREGGGRERERSIKAKRNETTISKSRTGCAVREQASERQFRKNARNLRACVVARVERRSERFRWFSGEWERERLRFDCIIDAWCAVIEREWGREIRLGIFVVQRVQSFYWAWKITSFENWLLFQW